MATATTGYTWASGNTVLPGLLNQMVNSATITLSNDEVTTAKILDANVTAAKLAATLDLSSKTVTLPATISLPAGAVMSFAMNSAPTGWLAADGTAVSRSTYAALFAAISTTYGVGDGSTTFALPDLRGIFVRGSGSQTIDGIAYSKTFAAKEGDAFQSHRHGLSNANTHWRNSGGTFGLNTSGFSNTYDLVVTGPTTDGANGTPRTAAETRPANIALLYCIKF
jgi:microcystin-dependent protein